MPRILKLAELLPTASPRRSQEIYHELLPLLEQPGFNEIDWGPLPKGYKHGSGLSANHSSVDRGSLARLLRREYERRQSLEQHDEAAVFLLANMRYAAMLDREGLIVQRLEADEVQLMGLSALARCRAQISAAKAAESARLLESVSATAEPMEVTLERDERWNSISMTWRYRLERAIGFSLWGRTPASVATSSLAVGHQREQCLTNLLMVDLALRAYRGDHGSWPESLQELAPRYLEAVPLDLYSGQPFLYRPEEPTFVLYSVGRGGNDDGGKFAAMHDVYPGKVGLDLDVDTLIRP